MSIPELTTQDCDDVLDAEIQLGQVCIAGGVNHQIKYNIKSGVYYVYENKNCKYTSKSQANALEIYNNLNKKVNL